MIKKIMFVCLLHCCYSWKIRSNETAIIQKLKTDCTYLCPFQKETADLYADDISCEINNCKIQHCVKGCNFLEKAFENDCLTLCNITNNVVKTSDLFCLIGCKQSLTSYFDYIKNEISGLQHPSLLDHTLSTTSLSLEWNEPNLMNESFVLQCCNVDLSTTWQFCQNQTWNGNTVSIEHLQPYTKYQFRVAIRPTPGDWYEIYSLQSSIIATLPGGLPTSPPKILTATAVSSSIISVMWKEGQFTNGPIISYILQISELPVGYAGVKDIFASKNTHAYMVQNLQPSKNYSVSISARNTAGLGPPVTVIVTTNPVQDKSKEKANLMIATEHSVYRIASDIRDEPVLMYNTTHVIKGIALHVHRELLFISDSSGGIIVTSSKGLLTPQEVLPPGTSKPSALTADWLNDHLYILSEVLHPSGSIVYQVARCALDGSNLIVVISGFIMKPHHIEVDPYNGYLFWVVRGIGLYRLDMIDISKVINHNVSPELILEEPNLGAFLVSYDTFRIIIAMYSQNVMISTSLDGQDMEKFHEKAEEPKFQNVVSLAMINGSIFWTNGEHMYREVCDIQNRTFSQNITDELSSVTNCIAVVANTLYSQPIPVPLNPPTNFQAIFSHDIAKLSWDKPYNLAGQGEGAWSAWTYRLIVSNKNNSKLFDFSDIKTTQFTVSGLRPGTEYALKVAAYTFSGEGPWSAEFRGKTIHRNTSLLWSKDDGLLLSDVTGYRVTKIEPVNYLETDSHFLITDIDWLEDQVYVSTDKQQVFWYNLTSNTFGRIQDINAADCISIEWLAKKIYWGNTKNKMIYRSTLSGTKQEMLPIVAAVESLFLDSLIGYLYWSTRNSIEGACLDGTQRKTFYVSRNTYAFQIVGLALDIRGSELYWIERSSINPRRNALMITDTKQSIQRHNNDYLIDKFNLINQDVAGGLCYIDQHLVWVRSDDRTAMVSGLNGTTTALLQSDNLSNLITCTAMDPFIRVPPEGTSPGKLNVIPSTVARSSIRVEGPYSLFNVSWHPVTGVNFGKVFYRVKMTLNEEETIMDTSDTFITVGNAKAHVPLKIIIQTWTLWATSDPVRVNLHSPTSTPSPPINPRIFVTHKTRPQFQDKEVLAQFRWSPPLSPNGIIRRYELSCWVFHGHRNSSMTACSSNKISANNLEYTLQNLPINKTYYFQVRACTEAGCGNWSSSVKTNLKEEFPIPKLLITTNEGLIKMDYDRKSFGISITGTERSKDSAYDADKNALYWIERKSLCESHLDTHFTSNKKLGTLKNEGTFLSYDWIAKNLYWTERNGSDSIINNLDLNRNEDDRHVKVLVQRNAVIENIIVSPMNSMLYWVEVEEQQKISTLMKSFIDGSNVKEFFYKETTFSKNDVSSLSTYNSEEQDVPCNCTRSIVGKAIALYPSSNLQYKLLWLEIPSGFIISSDLDGCFCNRIVKAASMITNGAPISITADFKKVYWLDVDELTLYSACLNEHSSSVEKISTSRTRPIHLQRVKAFGSHLQLFPDFNCLWPSLPPGKAQMVKHSSDAITLGLPLVQKESGCNNISMATVEYTIYYGIINDDGSSNCTSTVKSCSQVVTFDRIKKVTKLRPYIRYVFFVGVSNYYNQIKSIEPTIGESIIYRTAPGAPSPARNIIAVPVTPYTVQVRWNPPEYLNAAGVRYSAFWFTKYDNGSEEIQENLPWRHVDTSATVKGLLPFHNYTIWVKTFPVSTGGSILSTGDSNSENVTVQTYAEPGNMTLINATSYLLNISIPSDLIGLRFEVEFFDGVLKKWGTVMRNNNNFIVLNGLFPLTLYRVRLKIWYTTTHATSFLWLPDGFEFKTSGDRPSIPGIPALQHSKDEEYQIVWEPSNNYGTSVQTYSLEGKYGQSEQPREADLMDKYSNWTVYYNGTDNFWTAIGLKHNTKYIFRVRAKNEYGWSAYSEISEESELPNKVYWIILMMGIILMLFFSFGVITLITFLQLYRRKSSKNKSVDFVKNGILTKISNGDFELVNLRELPSGTNFIKNSNILYIPQNDNDKIDVEFSEMPRILREQITLTKFLGSGAFGEVYEGKVKNLLYENIETKVAIKALRKNATEQEKLEFLKEAELMNNFKHKHILQMLGICIDNDPNFIIMELMEGGDLLSYLRSNRSIAVGSSNLTFLDLLDICCDVASGCCYLEEMHFVHRDLACRNCLVSSKDPALRIVKIGDFGLARDIYKNDYYRKEGEGLLPVRWMAPESLVDGVFTRHSDVWSFGVLLWEVMSLGQQPYQARSNVEVLQYVRAGGRLSCPVNCPSKMYKLMETCWNFQPKERPTFKYCLKELEELKSDCSDSCVSLDYTTLSPLTNQKDDEGANCIVDSGDSNIDVQNIMSACSSVERSKISTLENHITNLDNPSP